MEDCGILVLDTDRNFLGTLKSGVSRGGRQILPIPCDSITAARKCLSEGERPIVAAFVTCELPDLGWIEVVELAHSRFPAAPIFLTHDRPPPLSEGDLKELGIQGLLKKPLTFQKMVARAFPGAAGASPSPPPKVDEAVKLDDALFLAIRARNFLFGSQSIFDLYVRVSPGHYLKILRAGDSLDKDRLESYLGKGVTSFHIRRDSQETYLKYCQLLSTKILEHRGMPQKLKVAQTMNFGEEAVKYLRDNGVKPEQLRYAQNFVSNAQELIKQHRPQDHEALRELLADVASYEHAVVTTLLSSLVARAMSMEWKTAINTIGLAAMLHDVGLMGLPENLKLEDESKMSSSELQLFRSHSERGAALLKEIPGMDLAVPHAIRYHHVRKSPKLNHVAEIVGLCDEFARLIAKAAQDPKLDALGIARVSLCPEFSAPVAKAFGQAFLLKPRAPAAA